MSDSKWEWQKMGFAGKIKGASQAFNLCISMTWITVMPILNQVRAGGDSVQEFIPFPVKCSSLPSFVSTSWTRF